MGVALGQYSDSSYRKWLKRNFCTSEKLVRREEFVVLSRLPDCGLGFGLSALNMRRNELSLYRRKRKSLDFAQAGQLIATQLVGILFIAFVF